MSDAQGAPIFPLTTCLSTVTSLAFTCLMKLVGQGTFDGLLPKQRYKQVIITCYGLLVVPLFFGNGIHLKRER